MKRCLVTVQKPIFGRRPCLKIFSAKAVMHFQTDSVVCTKNVPRHLCHPFLNISFSSNSEYWPQISRHQPCKGKSKQHSNMPRELTIYACSSVPTGSNIEYVQLPPTVFYQPLLGANNKKVCSYWLKHESNGQGFKWWKKGLTINIFKKLFYIK